MGLILGVTLAQQVPFGISCNTLYMGLRHTNMLGADLQ